MDVVGHKTLWDRATTGKPVKVFEFPTAKVESTIPFGLRTASGYSSIASVPKAEMFGRSRTRIALIALKRQGSTNRRCVPISHLGDCARITSYSSLIGLGRAGKSRCRPNVLCETWARMSHPDPNGAAGSQTHKSRRVWEIPLQGTLVILERPWRTC